MYLNQKPLLGRSLNYGHFLSNGLVGCWLFNEGSGSKIFDLSGNLITLDFGSGSAMPTWSAGKFGSCPSFDGGDYISKSISDWRINDTQGSISFWVKTASAAGTVRVVISSADGGSNFYFLGVGIWTNEKVFVMQRNYDTQDTVTGSTVLTAGVWYFVTIVSNGSSYSIYVNGQLESLTIVGGTNSGDWFGDTLNRDNIYIGCQRREVLEYYFNGLIDNVAIYNRALSASEVALLYREPFCMFERRREIIVPEVAAAGVTMAGYYYYKHLMGNAA